MTMHGLLATLAVIAVAYLLLAYAVGGPVALIRYLAGLATARRSRFRTRGDDVLAASRFTIPVTVILPARTDEGLSDAIDQLLAFNYPEFEVVVVGYGPRPLAETLRTPCALRACELFYRRTIGSAPPGAIYRSASHPRLLVVDGGDITRGAALNHGVNLARYRYVCCADTLARYSQDALLDAMQPATENPALVVGVTTSLAGSAGTGEPEPRGMTALLHRLGRLRSLLGRGGRDRLRLSHEGLPGFTIWRRDVLVELGGFATDIEAEHADFTMRVHRHMLGRSLPYRIVHASGAVGSEIGHRTVAALVEHRLERQRSTVRVLWRSRGMLLNPRYGRVGLIDLPSHVLSATVVPWFELACLLVLPFSAVVGVLSWPQLLAVFVALALGNGVLLNTAMLHVRPAVTEPTLQSLVLLGPVELFVSRPLHLYSRLVGLLKAFSPSPAG